MITGGGLSLSDDKWIEASPGKHASRWLFSTRALAKVYQARYLEGLEKAHSKQKLEFHNGIEHWRDPEVFVNQLKSYAHQKWNVYCKAPCAGPGQVLKYLSLYTHRVAISPNRVEAVETTKGEVTFRYKDYADKGRTKHMRLKTTEFLRRFGQHILPIRFCKIRHYGILSTRSRKTKIPQCRHFLDQGTPLSESTEPEAIDTDVAASHEHLCPHCQSADLSLILIIDLSFTEVSGNHSLQQRAPPKPPQ